MPRRRPAAIKIQKPKLDISGLGAAYEWMPVDKIMSFRLAFEWYKANQAALLFGDPLDAERKKWFDKATAAQALGDSETMEGGKVQAWTTAIRLFERKVWPGRGLPAVDKATAATQATGRVAAIQTVLTHLNKAYENFGVRFRITTGADREITPDGILIPERELSAMLVEPPFKVALVQAADVAKVKAIVKLPDGNQELDGELFMQNLTAALNAVGNWAAALNHVAFKPLRKARVAGQRAAAGATGTTAGPRVKVGKSQHIHVIDLALVHMTGKRAQAIHAIKEGMTIADLKSELSKIGLKGYEGWAIKTAVNKGAIALQ